VTENRQQDDVLLAMKELMRQTKKLSREFGDEAFDSSLGDGIEDLKAGGPPKTLEEIERYEEILAKEIRASDDPGMVTALDAENEVRTKSQNSCETAQLLARDAARDASLGITKEDWILEVLRGHGDDQEAQLGCLKHIAALWQDGPWPWPRTL
jgi:hypothetical protein